MDSLGTYVGGGHVKPLTRKEIETMKKNMKKVIIIQLKKEIYHEKEISEAEKILGKISSLQPEIVVISSQGKKKYYGCISKIIGLRDRFISFF